MNKTAKIIGTRYMLAVKNVAESARYYEQQLGFTTVWVQPGFQALAREQFRVVLGECPASESAFETGDHSYYAYIEVENGDELYAEFGQKGVDILSAPADTPWGMREFCIRTLDGHRIMFGEELRGK